MSIGRQVFFGIAIKAFSIIAGFLLVTFLARVLSPAVYGTYSVVLATVTILAIPTALGLPNYVLRETAKALGDGDGPLVRRIVLAALTLVLLVAAMVVVAVVLWSLLTADATDGAEQGSYSTVLWFGLGLVPGMALTQVIGAALRGVGCNTPGLLVGLVLRHVLFLLLLILWGLLPVGLTGSLTAVSAMALHVLAATLALSFGGVVWARVRPGNAHSWQEPKPDLSLRAMLASTGVMGIIAGAQTLNDNLDVIMVGVLRDAETAGIYKIASTAALVTVAGLQAINMVMMPHFARIHREGDPEVLQALASRSVRLILITAVPISVILIFFGRPLITLAFGAEYIDSYLPMAILVIGQLVSALFGSVMTILNMTGHELDTMKGVLLGCVVNIALNAVLIPIYGAPGAAFATALTVVAWNVYLHSLVRKRLSLNSTPFPFLDVAR